MPSLTPPLNTQSAPMTSPSMPSPMQPQAADPLANLRDIQLPSDVSSLPAFGWWLLAGAALLSLIALGYFLWRRYQQRQYRRAALQLCSETLESQQSNAQKLQSLNALLKRVALYAYPQAAVASLHGEQWQSLLQRANPAIDIDADITRALTDQLYGGQPITADELEHFGTFVKGWIKKHGALSIAPEAKASSDSTTQPATSTTQGGQHAHV